MDLTEEAETSVYTDLISGSRTKRFVQGNNRTKLCVPFLFPGMDIILELRPESSWCVCATAKSPQRCKLTSSSGLYSHMQIRICNRFQRLSSGIRIVETDRDA